MTTEPIGLAVIDKPAGMTSHDVVAAVRRALSIKRVGHAGTLDPPATGVLLVGVGRATRLLGFLQGTDKAYEGTFVLGSTTSTLDAAGEVTATFEMDGVADEAVEAAAARLTGELDQVPPMVSALSVGGRRLHELAREGIEVEREPRRIVVSAFDVAAVGEGTWRYRIECSSGTYVRSLVDDLGRALGGGAHVATLRRTRVGAFTIDRALALETFVARAAAGTAELLEPAAMVGALDTERVTTSDVDALVHGRSIRVATRRGAPSSVAVCREDGSLVAVCDDDGDGRLRPSVVLATQGADSVDG